MQTAVLPTLAQRNVAPILTQPALDESRAELLRAGYAVDYQTLECAQRFVSGQIAWKDFLLQSNFDNLPAGAWDEWAR